MEGRRTESAKSVGRDVSRETGRGEDGEKVREEGDVGG